MYKYVCVLCVVAYYVCTLTSMKQSDSGVASRLQRCSEQLVLIAKAICVLESGLCQYRIEQATADVSSLEENASLHIKRGVFKSSFIECL